MLSPWCECSYAAVIGGKFEGARLKQARNCDLVLFGGGGLIHSYSPTRANTISGTNWQIRLSDLKSLKPPIVLYGVGFNHFYGDPAPLPQMGKMFDILKQKGSLISFRNDGSKERFLHHFPKFNHPIHIIPDPGVFYRPQTTPQIPDKYAILQIAADRYKYRYKGKFNKFLNIVRTIIASAGLDCILIPHTPDDEKLYKTISLPRTKIYRLKNKVKDTAEIIGLYQHAEFSVSTRGHSQICSIGNQVPTFTISTHPKTLGFAETCELTDYVVRFPEEDNIQPKFERFLGDINTIRVKLAALNTRFDAEVKEFNDLILGVCK